MVFEYIRNLGGIKREDYLRAIGPEKLLGNLIFGNLTSLTELVTSSFKKSSSSQAVEDFQYYTEDSRYIICTITKDKVLYLDL
jgi:hypothetical protein